MSLYHLPAARTDNQLAMMKDLEERGVCIFCPEHLETEDFSPILIKTKHWQVKNNSFPYKGTRVHLLAIPNKHINTLSQLENDARIDLFDILGKCEKDFELSSYAMVARSGDMSRNGGSIEHLHIHIVSGDTDDPDHEPVRFKISSKPK